MQLCTLPIDVEIDIFSERCGNAACHGNSGVPAAGLDLVTDPVGARLVDQDGTMCTGKLVDSSSPSASLLISKLSDTPLCGTRMPLGLDPLTVEEQQCVEAWILDQTGTGTAAR